ncbi:MAG: hypothetical protein U0941_30110 [Planctomycetaceae bacterium]
MHYHLQIQRRTESEKAVVVGITFVTTVATVVCINLETWNLLVADAVTLIASIVTTITTVVLAYLNWRYVQLTQQMAQTMESAREPFVDIELDAPSRELRLAFINTGSSAARNIKFNVIRDCASIVGYGGRPTIGISKLHPIEYGISYLPAGQRLMYSAGSWDAERAGSLTIDISYSNDAGRSFTRTVHYELNLLNHVLFESFHNNLVSVSDAIKALERMERGKVPDQIKNFGLEPCPSCKELVHPDASKCRYCHEMIPGRATVST